VGETPPVDESFKSSIWWLQRTATTLNTNVCDCFCSVMLCAEFGYGVGPAYFALCSARGAECAANVEHDETAVGDPAGWPAAARYFEDDYGYSGHAQSQAVISGKEKEIDFYLVLRFPCMLDFLVAVLLFFCAGECVDDVVLLAR
jgi:hypothetical protein